MTNSVEVVKAGDKVLLKEKLESVDLGLAVLEMHGEAQSNAGKVVTVAKVTHFNSADDFLFSIEGDSTPDCPTGYHASHIEAIITSEGSVDMKYKKGMRVKVKELADIIRDNGYSLPNRFESYAVNLCGKEGEITATDIGSLDGLELYIDDYAWVSVEDIETTVSDDAVAKFKVGDKVRVVEKPVTTGTSYAGGIETTITRVDENDAYMPYLTKTGLWFEGADLVAVEQGEEQAKFKVGDKVRVVANPVTLFTQSTAGAVETVTEVGFCSIRTTNGYYYNPSDLEEVKEPEKFYLKLKDTEEMYASNFAETLLKDQIEVLLCVREEYEEFEEDQVYLNRVKHDHSNVFIASKNETSSVQTMFTEEELAEIPFSGFFEKVKAE